MAGCSVDEIKPVSEKALTDRTNSTSDHLESPLAVGRQAATRLFEFCSEAWSSDARGRSRPKDMCSYRYRMDSGEITATVILRLPGRSSAMVVPNSQNWFRNRSNAQNAAALRALVELDVVRRPTRREEEALFDDNPIEYHKLLTEERGLTDKPREAPKEAYGTAPPQFNSKYVQYRAPMLPQPRWAGRPTWRSLKSSKSSSPSSSKGSFIATPTSLGMRANSGDASTLADSEYSAPNDKMHYGAAHRRSNASTNESYYAYHEGYDGYSSSLAHGVYAAPPQAGYQAHQAAYYPGQAVYAGVYYSAAPSPMGAAEAGSPYSETSPYSVCYAPTPTVVHNGQHIPQFFSPDGQPQQAPRVAMAPQPAYPPAAYPPSAPFSEGQYCGAQYPSGMYPISQDMHSMPPVDQKLVSAPYGRGSWDYGAVPEVQARRVVAYPGCPASYQPPSYYEDYHYYHMAPYGQSSAMPCNGYGYPQGRGQVE